MLAKERFSDRPRCVCPVISAFLRGWNDRATHVERQLLAPYAARIVGSRGDRHVTRARRDLCLEWAGADLGHRPARNALARAGMRLRIAVYCSLEAALRLNEGAGDYASRVDRRERRRDGGARAYSTPCSRSGRRHHLNRRGHPPASTETATRPPARTETETEAQRKRRKRKRPAPGRPTTALRGRPLGLERRRARGPPVAHSPRSTTRKLLESWSRRKNIGGTTSPIRMTSSSTSTPRAFSSAWSASTSSVV